MNKSKLSESNFLLWGLICEVSHLVLLTRQKELSQYKIPVRQYELLRNIQAEGSKATLTQVAKRVQREVHVISRQTVSLEKEGLIKRTKNTSRSTLLTLEVTKKGLEMIEIARHSRSIDGIFSSLSSEDRKQIELILNRILVKVKKYNRD
jgi:DNA-binding MarR family transcriptional regulator